MMHDNTPHGQEDDSIFCTNFVDVEFGKIGYIKMTQAINLAGEYILESKDNGATWRVVLTKRQRIIRALCRIKRFFLRSR